MKLFNIQYLKQIILYDFFFKYMEYEYVSFYIFILYKYINFLKNKIWILSRIYRNLRLNFSIKSFFFVSKKKNINCNFIKLESTQRIMTLFSFIFINFLLFRFRFLKKNKICLYGQKFLFGIYFLWIDFYSFIKAIDEVILYRESFFFKFEISLIIYNLYFYINEFNKKKLNFLILSYYGFKFFLKKKKFKFKFYVRLI